MKLVVAFDDTLGLRLDLLAAAAACASSGGKDVCRSGCVDLEATKEFLRETDGVTGEPILAFLFGWKLVEIVGEPGGMLDIRRLLAGVGTEWEEEGGEDADGSGSAMMD